MPGVETAQLPATCGHTQTGSSKVFANLLGVSRIGIDTAAGTILGPGSQTVFVEGIKVSLPGDVVLSHAPCPVPAIHCAATTNPGGSPDVIVGTGFISGGGGGSHGDVAAGDLKITSFMALPSKLVADTPAAAPIFSVLIPVTFAYSITNLGDAPIPAFTIGFWKTPNQIDNPEMINPAGPFLLTRVNGKSIGATLLDEKLIPGLAAGETYIGSFTHKADPQWSKLLPSTWFAVFPDIDNEIAEIDEKNWVASTEIVVT